MIYSVGLGQILSQYHAGAVNSINDCPGRRLAFESTLHVGLHVCAARQSKCFNRQISLIL